MSSKGSKAKTINTPKGLLKDNHNFKAWVLKYFSATAYAVKSILSTRINSVTTNINVIYHLQNIHNTIIITINTINGPKLDIEMWYKICTNLTTLTSNIQHETITITVYDKLRQTHTTRVGRI